jgi:hypothetical protein
VKEEVRDVRRDVLLYGSAIVLFGGVVLWAAQAPWQVAAIALAVAGALLLAAAFALRPAPTVLVVGEREDEDLTDLREAFRREGFRLERCPGPDDGLCPVLAGRPCPAHGDPVAAVVVHHPGQTGPLPPCGETFRIPELVVEEDSDRELEVVGRYGRVGLAPGPEAAVRALDRMLAGPTAA